jgi:enoyl-CoA hydratase/carnithine racemase
MPDLLIEKNGHVGWITLNRPEKANALRDETFQELGEALRKFQNDDDVRAIVLIGAGDRVFSAGIDLSPDRLPDSSRAWDDHTAQNANLCQLIWELDKPVISAVNGHAAASGCLLALVCDMCVVAEHGTFSEPEIRHGNLSPLMLLPWMTHMKPLHEFYYTGDRLSAAQALQLGLVNRVVPVSDLRAAAQALAARVAAAPLYSIRLAKRALRLTYEIKGFRASQNAHRWVDNYLLDSHGDTEKEGLFRILAEKGVKSFLERRDGPYSKKPVGGQ